MLYYLDKSELRRVQETTLARLGWLEKDLEDLVAEHIARFVTEDQLFVIAQSVVMQEVPDIMALDREGCLHIFELKRWKSSPENLLQVLRYGQKFGRHDYRDLQSIFARYYQKNGKVPPGEPAPELRAAHAKHFERDELTAEQFNRDQHFVVVTNGLDRATRDAIAYWGEKKLDVRTLLYRIYETKAKELLIDIVPYGTHDDDFIEEVDEGLTVVNTNATFMPDAWKAMLREGKAAAFYRRKTSIDGIAPGSPIALYHTGVGFVAIGKTTHPRDVAGVDDDGDQEHFVRCAFERVVDVELEPEKAVKAWEVNQRLEASHRFRQTVYTLPREAATFIRERLIANGASPKLKGPK